MKEDQVHHIDHHHVQVPGTTWAFRDDSYNGNDKSKMCMEIRKPLLANKTDGTLCGHGVTRKLVGRLGQSSVKQLNVHHPTQVGTDTTWTNINFSAKISL